MEEIFSNKQPKQLLNKASGYLTGYSHTLNPYAGCSFACSYCYVRQMPISLFRKEEWGTWVDIKEGAAGLLRKELIKAKNKGAVSIFMSSSTDPYQPIEFKKRVTRSLLEVMVENKPDFLLLQTRSPLVTRDIDLLVSFKNRIRVSMTIETDLEHIRKRFTPKAPSVNARLNALKQIIEAGIPAQVAIAPVLPSSDDFPHKLASIVQRVCLDDYFMGDGSGGKRTKRLGISSIYNEIGMEQWYHSDAYLNVYEGLKKHFADDQLFISQAGFLP
ncbi:radical SAM protein [Paenibacillus sp. GSMTC-2017]|uniref:SPL family radical SAM protein n=1 Tax=Paenibacillus sp. GSMTC-2017 TaxID=2794350 RepID=UPI0018D5BCE3|nr:radical SAM protein [Paenibacillus sp. GSMTC-2017]MBH5316256.1 radical SAM protein [Paenibacillus sp. GSMTC-2017]